MYIPHISNIAFPSTTLHVVCRQQLYMAIPIRNPRCHIFGHPGDDAVLFAHHEDIPVFRSIFRGGGGELRSQTTRATIVHTDGSIRRQVVRLHEQGDIVGSSAIQPAIFALLKVLKRLKTKLCCWRLLNISPMALA